MTTSKQQHRRPHCRFLVFVCGSISGCFWLLTSTTNAAVIIQDDFNYVVDRNATNAGVAFQAHGWTGVKAINNGQTTSCGYLYTTYDATLNSRVLVVEAHPTWSTNGILQTSFHLAYGSESHPLGTIPANVWFQFWTYSVPGNLWDSQSKLLYPCSSSYPCSDQYHQWLVLQSNRKLDPPGDNAIYAPPGGRYFEVRSPFANFFGGEPWNNRKLFQNLNSMYLAEGIWYQVRIHLDTSGPQGVYELWARQRGQSTWTKLSEWIGGVTPNFDWPIPAAQRFGDRVLSTPTTINQYDSTVYIDDFIMATSLADLEGGGGGTTRDTTPPAPPQNPRITP